MFILEKNKENEKFYLEINWKIITKNLSFEECENDEKLVKETFNEFMKDSFYDVEINLFIPKLKTFFKKKFAEEISQRKLLDPKTKSWLRILKNEKGVNKGNRILLLVSGVPWSWKSTWIKENGLEPYVVSTDTIRLMLNSLSYDLDNNTEVINQDEWIEVFNLFYEIIEKRMKKGLFTVVDNTNLLLDKYYRFYELANKYWYEINIKRMKVDFELASSRNKNRWYKFISDEILEWYFELEKEFVVPEYIREIKNITELNNNNLTVKKITHWKNVYYIGDIQGCPIELKTFLDLHYNEKDYFVFVWDLLDRGYDDLWVLKVIEDYKLVENENVYFIEWNHDTHLKNFFYGNKKVKVGSEIFDTITSERIKDYDIEKLGKLVNKFVLSTHFQIAGKNVFACHWWVPVLKEFYKTEELIKWVGIYDEHQDCDEIFNNWSQNNNSNKQFYLVHWHRNTEEIQTFSTKRTFNLEWKLEFGWELRVVKFHSGGQSEIIEIPSINRREDYFKEKTLLEKFSRNRFIEIKDLWEDLYSINFSRRAFEEKVWDKQTTKARWLFIGKNNEIYARSYDKFFNIWERAETKVDYLKEKFSYPVVAYEKYNGFLGIVGLKDDKVLYLSKTSNSSEFSKMVEKHLKKYEEGLREILKDWYTLVFEICDKNDEHIFEENERPILLDVIKNSLDTFEKLPYEELLKIWEKLWIEVKNFFRTLNNKEDFETFLKDTEDTEIEWYILEDSNWFMTKTKWKKYLFWKEIRSDIKKINGWNFEWVKHKDVIQIFRNNHLPYKIISIPKLRELIKGLWIVEEPINKFDKE